MSFDNDTLANAGGTRPAAILFTYVTDDSEATVTSAGYFNEAYTKFKVDDLIMVVVPTDTILVRVTSSAKGSVQVTEVFLGSDQTLQKAYDISSAPQITTTAPLGPVVLKEGTGTASTEVFRVLDSSDTVVCYVTGGGELGLTGPNTALVLDMATEGTAAWSSTRASGGASNIEITPKTSDGSGPTRVRIGRNSGSTGANLLTVAESNSTTNNHTFSSSGQDSMMQVVGGNLGIGAATAPTSKLHVFGDFTTTGNATLSGVRIGVAHRLDIGAVTTFNNDQLSTQDFRVKGTSNVNLFKVDVANNRVGISEGVPNYKLDVDGDFGFIPGNSVTPVDNGHVVFEATSNTTLTVKLKGTDGTIRSGTITLS